MPIAIESERAPAPIGPYSQAIRAGEFLFVSGQIPLSADGGLVGATASEQSEQILSNLSAILEAAGATVSDVVKTTIFLVDLSDFASVNEVYGNFFAGGGPPPARSTVQVSALPRGARVEIEVVAYLAAK
jgi:2-iminobutanoate/2-iminopropanoate deaminase